MKNTRYWNEDDAKAFVKSCLIWIGPGFHPDTEMKSYTYENGHYMLSIEDAAINQEKLNAACDLLGDDIYEIGMEFGRQLGYYPAPEPCSPIVAQMPSVAVLFGQEAIDDYNETGDAHAAAEKYHGAIEAYEFETEAEKQAFIYGLSEACHWDSNCLID